MILKKYIRKTPVYYASYLKRKFQTDNPFDIASSLGIEIFYAPIGKISGYYKFLKKHKCIYLNSDITDDKLMRLIMAHELGHAVMHPKENCYFMENKTFLLTSRNEVEANIFASCLLIPDEVILEHCNYTTEQLSRMLGYEKYLIELRLKSYMDI